jgi:serine/threonine protein kinase
MESRRYTEDEVLEILEGLLPVLEYLHGMSPPIIHRDLKPSNVMRREGDGELVLIDFGTVRDALKDRKAGGSTIAGTHGFMAPEQYEGRATPATDLYGLGALAIALLTRKDPAGLMKHGLRLEWADQVDISGPFAQLLEQLLSLDPEERPTASEVLRRVRAIRAGEILAPPKQVFEPRPTVRVRPASWGKLAIVISAIVPVLIWAMLFSASPASHPERHQVRPYASYGDYGPEEDILAWCEHGFARACWRWGQILEGRGRRPDARSYYQRACDRGHSGGCAALKSFELEAPSQRR